MTVGWRDTLLHLITPLRDRVRVIADPDGLLLDETLMGWLLQEGYEVLTYDDPWVFRIQFEEDFRERWDHGEVTNLLLVRSNEMSVDDVPYDVVRQSPPLYLSVSRLFSHLDRTILADLDRRLYDFAYQVDRASGPGRLSRSDSADRLLRSIYAVDPELVHSREDVWALITRIHQSGLPMSQTMAAELAERLSAWQDEFTVPLMAALASRTTWEDVLHRVSDGSGQTSEAARHFLASLGWDTQVGKEQVQVSPGLRGQLDDFLLRDHYVGEDWLERVADIAIVRLAQYLRGDTQHATLLNQLDVRFEEWAFGDYGLLQSLPPYPQPTLVHQIVHYMARQVETTKWALFVVDGMSYVDWLYIKALIDLSSYTVQERGVFAWVPTITSVSRKAIFSGRVPRDIGDSLASTSGEEKLWQQFWVRHDRAPDTIHFQKTADDRDPATLLGELTSDSYEVIGLVANMVDNLAHAAKMGMEQFLVDIKLWVTTGQWLSKMIVGLVDRGFEIVITSDHGHVPVVGMGKPPSGDVPNSKGHRLQVFHAADMLDRMVPDWGRAWPHRGGLPSEYAPLLAPPGKAYANHGQPLISHGGVSMEELIVPMVRITR